MLVLLCRLPFTTLNQRVTNQRCLVLSHRALAVFLLANNASALRLESRQVDNSTTNSTTSSNATSSSNGTANATTPQTITPKGDPFKKLESWRGSVHVGGIHNRLTYRG